MIKQKKILILVLNNKCNNACSFCTVSREGNQNPAFVLKKIEESAKSGFERIDFSGSEPTLNKHLFSYIEKAKKEGFKKRTLFTNGRLLYYKDFSERLAFAGINKIIFSLYSSSRKEHDFFTRSPNSFDQLIEGVKNAKSLKLSLGANLVVDKKNIKSIDNTIVFFKKLGIEFFIIFPVIASLYSLDSEVVLDKDYIFSGDDLKSLTKRLSGSLLSGLSIATNFIPFCFHSSKKIEIKSNKDLKKVFLVSESGWEMGLDEVINNITAFRKECVSCNRKDTCEGQIKSINFRDNYFSFWVTSDLHAASENKKRLSVIFKDASRLTWDRALFLGDTVEGEKGSSEFKFFNNFFKRYFTWEKAMFVLGNHDYTYKKNKPNLNPYKEFISSDLFYSRDVGNIRFICLPIDAYESVSSNSSFPRGLRKDSFFQLRKLLKSNDYMIKVVLSHLPFGLYLVGRKEEPLEELIPEKDMPDIWISGHSEFKSFQAVEKHKETFFINCAHTLHKMESKFILFQRKSSHVILKTRNHLRATFIGKDICFDIKKKVL